MLPLQGRNISLQKLRNGYQLFEKISPCPIIPQAPQSAQRQIPASQADLTAPCFFARYALIERGLDGLELMTADFF